MCPPGGLEERAKLINDPSKHLKSFEQSDPSLFGSPSELGLTARALRLFEITRVCEARGIGGHRSIQRTNVVDQG